MGTFKVFFTAVLLTAFFSSLVCMIILFGINIKDQFAYDGTFQLFRAVNENACIGFYISSIIFIASLEFAYTIAKGDDD